MIMASILLVQQAWIGQCRPAREVIPNPAALRFQQERRLSCCGFKYNIATLNVRAHIAKA
jgi:hypothetical protein